MKKVGFIGYRGMVGSVLLHRMEQEQDFKDFETHFFSTSQQGLSSPLQGENFYFTIKDANDLDQLAEMDFILTCQGGEYTTKIYEPLRKKNWQGYWIDAASTLRGDENSIIVLDPINLEAIEKGISDGIQNFIGGNCTVSLMLLSLAPLIERDLVEWISSMTYQSVSGAGAKMMNQLFSEMKNLGQIELSDKNLTQDMISIDQKINLLQMQNSHQDNFLIAANLIPWIDKALENGQSKEEFKGAFEANKILQKQYSQQKLGVDGTCVRVGVMRCHSQGFTIQLKKEVSQKDMAEMFQNSHPWLSFVSNEKEQTIEKLNPLAVSGKLNIAVGRIRPLNFGKNIWNAFSVGDQLLWGAAEPIRRALKILLKKVN